MKKYPLTRILLLFSILCLHLTGCAGLAEETVPPESIYAPKIFIATFMLDGDVLCTQTVMEGALPQPVTVPEKGDRHFLGWDNEFVPASCDMVYTAVFAKELTGHNPYLFPAEDGCLHPDDAFTGKNLREALTALSEKDEKLPAIPEDSAQITVQDLRTVMENYFPMACKDVFVGYTPNAVLTRSEAAVLLNVLLERQNETVALGQNAAGFLDVPPDRSDYADLMEASMPHKPGDSLWTELVPPTGMTPGWVIEDGMTRCFDENGYLIHSTTTEEGITFDDSGYVTSGSTELDGYVTEAIRAFQKEQPGADRLTLLEMAYDYVRYDFEYLRRDTLPVGATGWQVDSAVSMFEKGRGNCYSYAATFWSLAQRLGYQAIAISGTIGSVENPHSWVEIIVDGEAFVCDPQLEMANGADELYSDLFLLTAEKADMFTYYSTIRFISEEDA